MKAIVAYIKLVVGAGDAKPTPPIGPALGQRGLNIMQFCKDFNAATQGVDKGTPIPVVITVYQDKSFTFITKTPPVSYLLKKRAKITKGSSSTKRSAYVGEVTMLDCRDIAELKFNDMNADTIEAATAMVVGSAHSIGIKVL